MNVKRSLITTVTLVLFVIIILSVLYFIGDVETDFIYQRY